MWASSLNPDSKAFTSSYSPSHIHRDLEKLLLTHDPHAKRLYDCIDRVQMFVYNCSGYFWENSPYIEGRLFAYERERIVENQSYLSYALAIINQDRKAIEHIDADMSVHVDGLRLLYQIRRNDEVAVFCLNVAEQADSQRIHAFILRSIHAMHKFREQQQPGRATNRPAASDKRSASASVREYVRSLDRNQ